MNKKNILAGLSYAQKERLAFIDFALQFFGQVSRSDLLSHFKTGLASCTRDLTLYRELAPSNLVLKHETKQYYRTDSFIPVFEHHAEDTINSLCRGFGDGISTNPKISSVCIGATQLIHIDPNTLATVMRAIHGEKAVSCTYYSISSGETSRIVVPHSIANNGHRWHIRAFDRKSKEFRDFLFTRLQDVAIMETDIETHEKVQQDKEWNTELSIELMPHPNLKHSKGVELDHQMVNGKRVIRIKEALAGYLMRQWNVDCSINASLSCDEYQLAVSNIAQLNNIRCLDIAPGYKE